MSERDLRAARGFDGARPRSRGASKERSDALLATRQRSVTRTRPDGTSRTSTHVVGPAPTEPPAPDGETKPGEPAAEPPTTTPTGTPLVVRQPITIPGYYVRETTVGYHYPEPWAIEQTGVNAYRWRMLPAQFVPK
jgi:hypothetical protein